MYHAHEVVNDDLRVRREDLPDFKDGQGVATYLSNNPSVGVRAGKFVKLQWEECVNPLCPICKITSNGGW